MDDEDTKVGPAPKAHGGPVSVMFADTAELALDDTGEWEDTDREMFAQGTMTKMIAQHIVQGRSADQAMDWAANELEGFMRS